MKAIIILLLSLLTGCGIANLNDFTVPNDMQFLECIDSLNTPKKICQYMCDNFEYEYHALISIDPYTLWKTKKGDCNDMSAFAVFVADYNGIEVYQIKIITSLFSGHTFAVYKEEDLYSFSSNYTYYKPEYNSFREMVEWFFNEEDTKWYEYTVYNEDMKIIERGKRE